MATHRISLLAAAATLLLAATTGATAAQQTIRCESKDGRYTSCGQVDRRQQVEIRRQLSNQQCIFGRNWGVDDRQLWVDDGCRAVFVVY